MARPRERRAAGGDDWMEEGGVKSFLYVCEVGALLLACWAGYEGRHDVAAGNIAMACYFLLHIELRQKRTAP